MKSKESWTARANASERSRLSALRRQAEADAEHIYADGECIVAEGSIGREMYIVAEGRVRIEKASATTGIVLGHIERGDFFGEMSLLESLPRHASAYAVGETRIVVIEPGGLLLRVRRDPTLAVEMLNKLSHRLRIANGRLVELLEQTGAQTPSVPVWEQFADDGTPDET